MKCHCGGRLQTVEVRERDASTVKRRTYECPEGHKVNTYEIPESAWKAAQHDIKKAVKGQLYHRKIAARARLAEQLRAERLAGASCPELAVKYAEHKLSIDMIRYYTRLPRERLYPAAKKRKADELRSGQGAGDSAQH